MDGTGGMDNGAECERVQTERPLDITVLMGGESAEREVSIMSGTLIADALERIGHRVTRSDISASDTSALDRDAIDAVFIALHGPFGESGEVQTLCEERELRYTGSGARASELAMDKPAAKQIFRRCGLTTPDWMIIEDFHGPEVLKYWLEEIPPPLVIKPVDGGSSIDIYIVRDTTKRDRILEEMLDDYGRVMLEGFVEGRELTVGILADQPLPLLEIIPRNEFYDYDAKYTDDAGTQYSFEHGLDSGIVEAAQQEALTAHRSLGCRDFSRVDFILDPAGELQVLELNTIPGFTAHSLLPMAAAHAGISFEQLADRLVQMAMERDPVCSRTD